MTIKKQYDINDPVWIYGISRGNAKPTKGTVIKIIDLQDAGYNDEPHYIVAIPTEIENLLEIRTWHNMSQDQAGPVGSFRQLGDMEPTVRFANKLGFAVDEDFDPSDPSPDQVHAAIEKSIKDTGHGPLNLKESKPKRKFYSRKKTG